MRSLLIVAAIVTAAPAVAGTDYGDEQENPDARRVHESLQGRQFGAEVCFQDVNGDGANDILIVHQVGDGPSPLPDPPPQPDWMSPWSPEQTLRFQKGFVQSIFWLAALDGVLEVRRGSEDWQAEHVYLEIFEELYEWPLSEIADCGGDIEDEEYRGCLLKGVFGREKTDQYPTLPRCTGQKMPLR